mmetsp:Transcript_25418/g.76851  ORF Transcript_25418/g.76851 Transcript_25418/m.76851 type:complete len:208 (+) Transcript_25418:1416-2039(+)
MHMQRTYTQRRTSTSKRTGRGRTPARGARLEMALLQVIIVVLLLPVGGLGRRCGRGCGRGRSAALAEEGARLGRAHARVVVLAGAYQTGGECAVLAEHAPEGLARRRGIAALPEPLGLHAFEKLVVLVRLVLLDASRTQRAQAVEALAGSRVVGSASLVEEREQAAPHLRHRVQEDRTLPGRHHLPKALDGAPRVDAEAAAAAAQRR